MVLTVLLAGWHPWLSRHKMPPDERRLRLILTNKPSGTLYIGVAANLRARGRTNPDWLHLYPTLIV